MTTRSLRNFISAYILFVLFLSPCLAKAQEEQPKQPDQNKAFPFGPISIQPTLISYSIEKRGDRTYFIPIIRFKITNTTASNIKIALFSQTFKASDNLGESLFYRANNTESSGIININTDKTELYKAFTQSKGMFVVLTPGQPVECQTTTADPIYREDKEGELHRTYLPKSITVSGTFGVMYETGEPELIPFSLSDLPIVITRR